MDVNQDEPNYPQILFAEGVNPAEAPNELIEAIIDALKKVYDPEIPVDIFELGLIYVIEFLDLTENNIRVRVDMTLTAPGCPVAGEMPGWVSNAVYSIPEIKECMVDLVWEPFWTPQRMSLRAKLELNML
ncbi:DUF59 domain-containing protein [Ignatzschineria ureiclastica]|uniref:DUF59 domain-containing protein n=2 Tax=Ignatzschineria TaxID=112008 RepID=A0A2U2AGH0_9GAMM|nr:MULTISPECIES: iron-sulfur cluster assembly protein [Ignatzschineria]PWD81751.1 DUF59 domain-containing protein [Ignatzschineria ureiclastica]GGZ90268.1 SUF system Fe-S cluster assembly protein [Ignatzschineria ureiclastica]